MRRAWLLGAVTTAPPLRPTGCTPSPPAGAGREPRRGQVLLGLRPCDRGLRVGSERVDTLGGERQARPGTTHVGQIRERGSPRTALALNGYDAGLPGPVVRRLGTRALSGRSPSQQRRRVAAVPSLQNPRPPWLAATSTLGLADDAAAAGNYGLALWWLAGIEAIGDRLPDEYLEKRSAWTRASHT